MYLTCIYKDVHGEIHRFTSESFKESETLPQVGQILSVRVNPQNMKEYKVELPLLEETPATGINVWKILTHHFSSTRNIVHSLRDEILAVTGAILIMWRVLHEGNSWWLVIVCMIVGGFAGYFLVKNFKKVNVLRGYHAERILIHSAIVCANIFLLYLLLQQTFFQKLGIIALVCFLAFLIASSFLLALFCYTSKRWLRMTCLGAVAGLHLLPYLLYLIVQSS